MMASPRDIQSGPDVSACRKCSAEIYWIKNENGKAEPFDRRPTRVLLQTPGEKPRWMVATGHINHFVTCPNADSFRRKR